MFALISWVVFGLIIGVLARLVLMGSDQMGWLTTLGLGVAGSVAGGFVSSLFWDPGYSFQPGGFFLSLLGAISLLLIADKVGRGAAIS